MPIQISASFGLNGQLSVLVVFCVGGSKELAVLYESYSTATFVMQHITYIKIEINPKHKSNGVC